MAGSSKPSARAELNAALAEAEAEFKARIASITEETEWVDRQDLVGLFGLDYFETVFRLKAEFEFEKMRARTSRSFSAAEFKEKVAWLAAVEGQATFMAKIWPHLRKPRFGLGRNLFEDSQASNHRAFSETQQEYLRELHARAEAEEARHRHVDEPELIPVTAPGTPDKKSVSSEIRRNTSSRRWLRKGDLTLVEGHDTAAFRTAEEFAGITARTRQMAIQRGDLRVVGKGQNRKITVASLFSYIALKEKTKQREA